MRQWTQNGSTSKYRYNYEAFKEINDEQSAYWLGFLYADGGVSKNEDRFSLHISEKDILHLKKYRDFIAPDRPLENNSPSCRLFVSSKEITSDLISKGCTPQKSLTLQPPPEGAIPKHLVRHFIRGYFDGDGCARMVKDIRVSINFTGTENFISYIVDTLKKQGIVSRAKVRKATGYNAYIWANESVNDLKKIYKYLYSDATLYLERKRVIFDRVN